MLRTVVMCPAVEDAYLNRVLVNPGDDLVKFRHIQVATERAQRFVYTLKTCTDIPIGSLGLNYLMRRQIQVSHNRKVSVNSHRFDLNSDSIGKLVLSVDFLHEIDRQNISEVTKLNVDEMAKEFLEQFQKQAVFVGEILAFRFQGNKTLKLQVLQVEEIFSYKQVEIGLLVPNSRVLFQRSPDALLQLTRIINTKINFEASNIQSLGFKEEFIDTAKRALVSGKFSNELIVGSGIKAIKGLLLYGPPGSGKSSAAIQFGKMLSAEQTEIHCCSKEMNLEKLIQEQSDGLRIVILDQIDDIFRQNQTEITQFYSQLECLCSAKNILVIGITSHIEAIPTDLLNARRLEFQMELTLPSVYGRIEILNVSQSKMEVFKLVDGCEVDLSQWHFLVLTFLMVTCGTWGLMEKTVKEKKKADYAMYSAIGPRKHVWE